MMTPEEILWRLPYSKPFLFVDEIISVNENHITGSYFFDDNHDFYRGHFVNKPVTPGVILTETMAQIGVVSLGIYLLNESVTSDIAIGLTSTDIEFVKPVFPNTKVIVSSEKKYFRFGKLKCAVSMANEAGEIVCMGSIAGMIVSK